MKPGKFPTHEGDEGYQLEADCRPLPSVADDNDNDQYKERNRQRQIGRGSYEAK